MESTTIAPNGTAAASGNSTQPMDIWDHLGALLLPTSKEASSSSLSSRRVVAILLWHAIVIGLGFFLFLTYKGLRILNEIKKAKLLRFYRTVLEEEEEGETFQLTGTCGSVFPPPTRPGSENIQSENPNYVKYSEIQETLFNGELEFANDGSALMNNNNNFPQNETENPENETMLADSANNMAVATSAC